MNSSKETTKVKNTEKQDTRPEVHTRIVAEFPRGHNSNIRTEVTPEIKTMWKNIKKCWDLF